MSTPFHAKLFAHELTLQRPSDSIDKLASFLSDIGRNRQFILVQLPEPTADEHLKTIAEITKKRVRRVIIRLNERAFDKLTLKHPLRPDPGFKVFKLQSSNFKAWNADIQAIADRQPARVICLDAGFAGNDQLKTNAVQQMRARGVTKFQTI